MFDCDSSHDIIYRSSNASVIDILREINNIGETTYYYLLNGKHTRRAVFPSEKLQRTTESKIENFKAHNVRKNSRRLVTKTTQNNINREKNDERPTRVALGLVSLATR